MRMPLVFGRETLLGMRVFTRDEIMHDSLFLHKPTFLASAVIFLPLWHVEIQIFVPFFDSFPSDVDDYRAP